LDKFFEKETSDDVWFAVPNLRKQAKRKSSSVTFFRGSRKASSTITPIIKFN
jgi:hypothetical protein